GAEVHVVTDLAITGRPAQFGRGVMEEVGQKLINQFADCLAGTLGEGSDEGSDEGEGEGSGEGEQRDAEPVGPSGNGSSGAPQAAEVTTAPTRPAQRPAGQSDTIDLLDVAGAPVAKRLAPVLGVLVLIIVWWLRRR
ncbi:MAG TPA: hypothetical protein VMM13_06685, partial [Euzebya sp.]|nr:hypothetical protein [Euzebya sp.]